MSSQTATLRQISQAHDGARILWRPFLATEDMTANEAHVREFSPRGDYVRLAKTNFKDDKGVWLRVGDLRLLDVLEAHVELKTRPRPKRDRVEGDEWKDGGEE